MASAIAKAPRHRMLSPDAQNHATCPRAPRTVECLEAILMLGQPMESHIRATSLRSIRPLATLVRRSNANGRLALFILLVIVLAPLAGWRVFGSGLRPDAQRWPATVNASHGEVAPIPVPPYLHTKQASPAPLAALAGAMRPKAGQDLSILLHALVLFGQRIEFDAPPKARVLDLILDHDRAIEFFDGCGALVQTRHGASFPVVEKSALVERQKGAQAHPGQALAALGMSGVPISQPIRLAGGAAGQVQMLLSDLCANFNFDEEIYWNSIALSLYLPPAKAWQNKLGERFTFDDLAQTLLNRETSDTPCFGTHQLISLTVLLRADMARGVLSRRLRNRVVDRLKNAVRTLLRRQIEPGVWSPAWNTNGQPISGYEKLFGASPAKLSDLIHVTGHHLEWLILLPDDIRPADDLLLASAQWLTRSLNLLFAGDPHWPENNYCTAAHSLRSVSIVFGADLNALPHE